MFPKAKNIETAFRFIRTLCIITVLTSLITSAGISWYALHKTYQARQKIYILAAGKVLEALSSDRKDNIPAEARDHITRFHQYFFSLDPDEKVIQQNIDRALYLADASAKKMYDNLKENGFYSGIIAGNITQQITIDSIYLDTTPYPYYFRCFARQTITRPTSIATRQLVTQGWLRNTSRSDNNPHGFLIERWTTIDNKDLQIQPR